MVIKEKKTDNLIIYMIESDWSGRSLLDGQTWEPHITNFLERNFNQESVLIDVGSNYGWHSIKSSPKCKTIYSFEPQKLMYDIQLSSITKNNISNIHLYNCGLGDDEIKTEMNPIDYETWVHIGDLSVGVGGEKISIKKLDSLNIPKVDFIKIDVQGYEKYVLLGALETINKNKPTIIVEIENHQLRRFNYGVTELFDLIRGLGYYIYFLDYHYPSDHVCVHKDNLKEFVKYNSYFIKELQETNNLNHNVEHGVTEKIIYDEN